MTCILIADMGAALGSQERSLARILLTAKTLPPLFSRADNLS